LTATISGCGGGAPIVKREGDAHYLIYLRLDRDKSPRARLEMGIQERNRLNLPGGLGGRNLCRRLSVENLSRGGEKENASSIPYRSLTLRT